MPCHMRFAFSSSRSKRRSRRSGSKRRSRRSGSKRRSRRSGFKRRSGSKRRSRRSRQTSKRYRDMNKLKRSTKKYSKRPGPPYPANKMCGEIRKGNDGKMYESRRNSRGICQWRKRNGSKRL